MGAGFQLIIQNGVKSDPEWKSFVIWTLID